MVSVDADLFLDDTILFKLDPTAALFILGLVLHARANGMLEVLSEGNVRTVVNIENAYPYGSFGLNIACYACGISCPKPFCPFCLSKDWVESDTEKSFVKVRFRQHGEEAKYLFGKVIAKESDQTIVAFEDGDIFQIAKTRLKYLVADVVSTPSNPPPVPPAEES